ncbi:MAP kinase-interacting serine/threonine-protein kinase 1 [Desmophyllum pertusum]|uniref:MAP kinase-interacting serine/threonine-protein kinase 1 n=1 Tax=Desmophyllum pertusum TaxID=174260 RepID=A0A9W9ZT18_9CNID|nr:MAP kinase-interacting serine/threonine-protein kinase 1 [Desmophyllum pertusum]
MHSRHRPQRTTNDVICGVLESFFISCYLGTHLFYGKCGTGCGWEKGEKLQIMSGMEMLMKRIQEGEYDFPSKEWDGISLEAKNLISHLLIFHGLLIRFCRSRRFRTIASSQPMSSHPPDMSKQHSSRYPHLLTRNMNTHNLQEFAAEAVAMNRMFSEASAIYQADDNDNEFQRNIKPRVLGLSPPSNSVLARRRAASSKSHSPNPLSKDVDKK